MAFPKLPSSPNFFHLEEEILAFWKENKIFEKSIETRSENNPYSFYDGPPFITGLPHYGHLLGSSLKDMVTRFWTQKGKRIDRVRGWDCHGIYAEQKVQEKLGLKSNKDIEEYGIQKFIEECFNYTKDISGQREWYVDHVGRRVDFQNAYKTQDNDYMESVMRVFKSLYDKGLIYEGKRVSLYSTKLNTPISNYEVALDNSYADFADPAITVKFPIIGKNKAFPSGEQFADTDDGFTHYVQAIIKDEKGGILSLYNQKHGGWQFPGGKVDLGESPLQALTREIKEELGVDMNIGKKVGGHKVIIKGFKLYIEFYEAAISNGEVKILEPHKHTSSGYAYIGLSENELGWNFTINNAIIDDIQEITQFKDLYHFKQVLENKSLQEGGENHRFNFLARTTTPRTIPANVALVASPSISYVQLFDLERKEYFILAENLVSKYFKDPSQYLIIYKCKGVELEGVGYKAPFNYYVGQSTHDYKVYLADYVTDTDGTGIVHTAPEFGEEDFKTGLKYNLTQSQALDEQGKYTSEISDYQNIFYRDANDQIMEDLKSKGLLFKKESITHSVAMCPRTGIPLIYKTQDNWFISIKSVKDQLIDQNEKINRVPEHLKHGRFEKSMESAPDWCISRTRYWATPMPVWAEEEANEAKYTPPHNISITLAQETDAEEIQKVRVQARIESYVNNDIGVTKELIEKKFEHIQKSIDKTKEDIQNKRKIRIVKDGDAIVGFKFSPYQEKERIRLGGVYLLKKYQHQGIGTELMKLSLRGYEKEEIQCTVVDYNYDTISFYKKLGFEINDSAQEVSTLSNGVELKLVTMIRKPIAQKQSKYIICGSREDIFALDQSGSKILEKRDLDGKIIYRDTVNNKELDLHRPYVDNIWGTKDGKRYNRIKAVLDPWLESGSMPYAQVHYPFENKQKFEKSFPADFIAEYLGQVRCWFFFMHALGVMLFDGPAFTNVVCTGVLAGNDGRKMSKSYGNYPDPEASMKQYGCDSLRMYYASNPIVAGGDMNLSEEGRKEIIRKINLPLWNSFSFFVTYANIDEFTPTKFGLSDISIDQLENDLDIWIIGKLALLIHEVNTQMQAYQIQKATAPIYIFMDDLTNRYIRRNRRRFWKGGMDAEKQQGYETLYVVLIELCKVLAPFMPFLSEYIFKHLTGKESVHLEYWTE